MSKLTSKTIGFAQSTFDECVFYRDRSVYVLYTDDSILAGLKKSKLDRIIEDMKKAGLKLTVRGGMSDFLGVQIERKPDGTIHLTQPHLINQILEDLRLDGPDVATKSTRAKVGVALHRHTESQPFDVLIPHRLSNHTVTDARITNHPEHPEPLNNRTKTRPSSK